MPYLEANGERLYYEVSGEGPAIIFLHSLGSSSHAWRKQKEHLQSEYKVILLDRRGHGKSSHNGSISIDTGVDDVEALLDHLQVERVHIAGLSMGGTEALRFYERHSERVRSLILCDTFAMLPPDRVEERLASLRQRLAAAGSMAQFARNYVQDTFQPHTPAEVKEEMASVLGSMQESSYLAAAVAVYQANVGHVPETVKVPTLILVGEEDDRTTPEFMREQLASKIPQASFHVIPQAGHIVNLDQPERFNQLLTEFLASISA